ncbi:MAG TPA: SDR family NAD(P)-dependent oxidoreductase [Acidisarcina sp.]
MLDSLNRTKLNIVPGERRGIRSLEVSSVSLKISLAQIDLNARSLTELEHRLLPPMIENRSGRILNAGSTAGDQPGPIMAVYFATKAYVNSFSEAFSYELKGTGITVTEFSATGLTQFQS